MNKLLTVKTISVTLGLVLLIWLIGWAFFSGNKEFLKYGGPDAKQFEIKDLTITGWQKGIKAFEITTKYVWSQQDLEQANIENVVDGKIFNNRGQMIIENIKADKMHANSYTRHVNADGHISAKIVSANTQSQNNGQYQFSAEQLFFDGNNEITYLKDNIKFIHDKKESELYASQARIDHQKEVLYFEEGVTILSHHDTLYAKKLEYDFQKDYYEFFDGFNFERKIKNLNSEKKENKDYRSKQTKLRCSYAKYTRLPGGAGAVLRENLLIEQPGKIMLADYGLYDEAGDFFKVTQNAKVYIHSQKDFFTGPEIARIQKLSPKEILKKETFISADQVTISIDSQKFTAENSVQLKRVEETVYADKAEYDEPTDKITITGHVKIQKKDGAWLLADQVIVDIGQDEMYAIGAVEAEVNYKKDN
jgi:lipopolysaccharide export system protein LptA